MYNLYTDKSEKFQCKIELEGASIKGSDARLVLESEEINLLFKGKINTEGLCEININKLKNLLPENTKGKLKLEVIADGEAYFCPWSSDFQVLTSKKVTVEVLEKSKEVIKETIKPSIKVSGIPNQTTYNPFTPFVKLLKEYKVNKKDIQLDNKTLLPVIKKYKNDIKNTDTMPVFINKIKNSF